MNQINSGPNQYDFGLDFDYSVWPIDTVVELINVPWNNDYRDIVKFASKSARDAWMSGRTSSGIKITQLSYVRANEPVRIDVPFNRAIKYNYLRVTNPIQPIPNDEAKAFFYFILDVRYIAPFTTELVIQLDVWQTYGYDITFGNCYVERSHIGIANKNQLDNFGRDYLTTPEGLNLGTDLVIRNDAVKTVDHYGTVIAVSTVDLVASGGTVEDPKLVTATSAVGGPIATGAAYYAWKNSANFYNWMTENADKPWITQGIMSVMVVPRFEEFYSVTIPNSKVPHKLRYASGNPITTMLGSANWRETLGLSHLPNKFKKLKKFLTSPYAIFELTTFSGNPIIIKPELWATNNPNIVETISVLMPNAKHVIWPKNYNSATPSDSFDYGEKLDFATSYPDFPKSAVVNDGAINWLASNTNTVAYQRESADWAQQRALASAQASYDIATGAMNTAQTATDIGISSDIAQTNINQDLLRNQTAVNAISGVAGGATGGITMGGVGIGAGTVGGAISGIGNVANAGYQIAAGNESLALRNSVAQQSVDNANRQTGLIRDTNKNLADWSARGDYANAIAAVNAKVQDAQMIQPTVSGQAGGAQYNILNDGWNIHLRFKTIDNAYIEVIGNYWLRYGYAIQRFIKLPASLMVMSKFTYWKLSETYITASLAPEGFKQAIRGIFEKGVTVWANPSDIGNIDIADNTPLGGISY